MDPKKSPKKVHHPDATQERRAWMALIKRLRSSGDAGLEVNMLLDKLITFGAGRIKRYEKKSGGL